MPLPRPLQQIGVVSYLKHRECGRPGNPGMYARVTEFLPWMEEIVQGEGSRLCY